MKIIANKVSKTYGDVTALDGLSLEIPSGSTFGVLGTNGAGKTTLFKLLVGHDTPDEGQLVVGERNVSDAGVDLRKHVGYLPERIGFPPALTGREVLQFHARMRDLPMGVQLDETLATVGLSPADADRAVGGYSNGMRRRLGLAAALLPEPSVLILDEPTAGLDPRGVRELREIISQIQGQTDATILITSHVLEEIETLCERVAILQDGSVRQSGRIETMLETAERRVMLEPRTDEEVGHLTAVAAEFGSVTVEGSRVVVDCAADSIPSLFAAIESTADLSDVQIEQPTLEGTFLDATDREVTA